MVRTVLMICGIALALIGLAGASGQKRRPTETVNTEALAQLDLARSEKAISTQQRINRYFHSAVMPKLKTCWNSLQGTGSIELEHNYKKGPDGSWVPSGIVVSQSTLARGQDQIALRCMQNATNGTSFQAESADGSSYVVKWSWPVPFPQNTAQLTTAMFARRANTGGGTSGGCDGRGTAAKCYTCDKDGHECEKVCVGYAECKLQFPGRLCGAQGSCASGGPLGVLGGSRIY